MYVLVPDVLTAPDIDRVEGFTPTRTAVPEPLVSPVTIVLSPPDQAPEKPVPPFWPARFEAIGYWKVSENTKAACEALAPHATIAPITVTPRTSDRRNDLSSRTLMRRFPEKIRVRSGDRAVMLTAASEATVGQRQRRGPKSETMRPNVSRKLRATDRGPGPHASVTRRQWACFPQKKRQNHAAPNAQQRDR